MSDPMTEREAFEKWVQTISGWTACKQRGKPMHLRQNMDGSYNDCRVNDRWFAWQARAHLSQPAQAVGEPTAEDHLDSLETQLHYFLSRVKDFPERAMVEMVENNIRERLKHVRAALKDSR
jgi:hypothetical protein